MDDFQTLFTFLVGLLVALLAITILVALVYALTGLLNATRRAERAAQLEMSQAIATVPRESQEAFVSYTNRRAKSPTIAVLLALFLGWLGAHRFYLRDYGLGFMYLAYFLVGIPALVAFVYFYANPTAVPLPLIAALLLFLWLGIPALFAFFDSFLMPKQTYVKNQQMFRQAQDLFARPAAVPVSMPYSEAQLSGA